MRLAAFDDQRALAGGERLEVAQHELVRERDVREVLLGAPAGDGRGGAREVLAGALDPGVDRELQRAEARVVGERVEGHGAPR